MSTIDHEPTRRLGGDAVPSPDASPVPEYLLQWDRYEIRHRLGSGGMGEVFEAWDPRLGRSVALKFLGGSDPATLERFEREARAQAHVEHPAICKVFDVGEVAGRRYIAMQEIDGVTLDRIARELSPEQKVQLVREIAEAVHAAHRGGLIHRDLKPSNILVERHEDGSVRPFIVDFGLARDQRSPGATIAGTIAGTLGYMSPEQARGRPEEVDRRTDVYNLGIILYELIAERPAFHFDGMLDSLVRLQSDDTLVVPPRRFNRTIHPDLETIVMKALERQPGRRYHSAHAMAEDLRRFLEGEPIVARRSSLVYRLRTRIRKHRLLAAVIAAALVLLAIAGGWALRERWRADARAQLAERFGTEVSEIGLVTRVAGMLPPERAVPMHALVLPRMARIREQMRRSGPLAEGPGSYALARGSIVLGDYRGAWELLERARRAKYDTPDVHYARGQVLGQFYEDALTRAAGIGEAELRDAARADAARRFRAPAIEELRLAASATAASPELLRAQLALREERFDDAISAARSALVASPWLHEALLVEAAALRTRGAILADSGKVDEGLAMFGTAHDKLAAATAIARGDAAAYYEDCRLQYLILGAERFKRRLSPADATAATVPCGTASRLDPSMAAAWTARGAIHNHIAEDQLRRGDDPTQEAIEAANAMRRAIALDPKEPAPLAGLARAELTQARWGIPRGVDPRARLEASRDALERALKAEPGTTNWRLTLANALLTRGEYEQRVGHDARPWLQGAIEQGRKALQVHPDLFLVHNMLGNTYNKLADHEIASGGDPRSALAEATKAFDRAKALNDSNSALYNNHGNTWLTLAEYQARRGEPMEQAAESAIALYRRAIELRPDYNLAWYNVAYTNRLVALDRVRRAKDPMPALRATRDALAKYEGANPADVDAAIERARAAIIEARWQAAAKRDARPALATARQFIDRIKAADPKNDAIPELVSDLAHATTKR